MYLADRSVTNAPIKTVRRRIGEVRVQEREGVPRVEDVLAQGGDERAGITVATQCRRSVYAVDAPAGERGKISGCGGYRLTCAFPEMKLAAFDPQAYTQRDLASGWCLPFVRNPVGLPVHKDGHVRERCHASSSGHAGRRGYSAEFVYALP